MWRYLLQKLLLTVPTVLAVVAFVFLAIRLVPGDPAVIMAGDFADAQTLQRMRTEWGLDRPLPAQFGIFMGNLAQGDLGDSIRSRQPVTQELARRFWVIAVWLERKASLLLVSVHESTPGGSIGANSSEV